MEHFFRVLHVFRSIGAQSKPRVGKEKNSNRINTSGYH